jgi:hypothetical protein
LPAWQTSGKLFLEHVRLADNVFLGVGSSEAKDGGGGAVALDYADAVMTGVSFEG